MTDTPKGEHYEGNPGPAVDAGGNPVVDPTANVLLLVEAAVKRQDDLRLAEKEHVQEVLLLRAELRRTDLDCVQEVALLRAGHARELREAEAARIDAIRAVDVGAVARAAEVAAAQATALASQVNISAETLRNQVAAAATAQTVALAAALDPVQKDIADLRRAQYEQQGVRAQVSEGRASSGAVVGYIVGAIGVLSTLVTLIILFTQNSPA